MGWGRRASPQEDEHVRREPGLLRTWIPPARSCALGGTGPQKRWTFVVWIGETRIAQLGTRAPRMRKRLGASREGPPARVVCFTAPSTGNARIRRGWHPGKNAGKATKTERRCPGTGGVTSRSGIRPEPPSPRSPPCTRNRRSTASFLVEAGSVTERAEARNSCDHAPRLPRSPSDPPVRTYRRKKSSWRGSSAEPRDASHGGRGAILLGERQQALRSRLDRALVLLAR